LERLLPVDRYVLLAGVVLLGLGGLLAFYRWARATKLFLFALFWFIVGILPQWLALDFAYVITSPRLMYLSAAGAAMLWAGVVVLLWTKRPSRWWLRALASLGAIGMLLFSFLYVRDKMELAATLGEPLWQAVRAAEEQDETSSLLFVNTPMWIAPKDPTYRVGTEGLTFIPEYVGVQDFVYVNSGSDIPIKAVAFGATRQDWQAYVGYAGPELDGGGVAEEIRQADQVYATAYSPGGLSILDAGSVEQVGALPNGASMLATFGDGILMTDAKVEGAGALLQVDLWWLAQSIPDGDITVFLHVYNGRGQLVAQDDGYPLAGLFPPAQWQPGDLVHDVRHVILPEGLAEGDYTVAVGWYDVLAGERLLAVDGAGLPVVNNAFPVSEFHNDGA
jgi:hypothetical protein